MKRAIAVFGSVKAAGTIGEKAQRAKYTRRLELLRKSAQEGHLPSLYLLVTWPMRLEKVEGIKLPFKITIIQDGRKAAELTVQEYKLNQGLKPVDIEKRP